MTKEKNKPGYYMMREREGGINDRIKGKQKI
jgi:hypothetical protein